MPSRSGRAESDPERHRLPKYRRARIRHFLFTVGPHRVSGGRITRRHLAQNVAVREMDLGSHRWPDAFDGLRIGHVSDFHLGDLLPIDKLFIAYLALTGPALILGWAAARQLVPDLSRRDTGLRT